MIWIDFYVVTAFVVGVVLFVFAEFRQAAGASHRCSGICAFLAGFLWPVLLIGAVQFGLIVAVGNRLRGAAASADELAESRSGWAEAGRSLLCAGEGVPDSRIGQFRSA